MILCHWLQPQHGTVLGSFCAIDLSTQMAVYLGCVYRAVWFRWMIMPAFTLLCSTIAQVDPCLRESLFSLEYSEMTFVSSSCCWLQVRPLKHSFVPTYFVCIHDPTWLKDPLDSWTFYVILLVDFILIASTIMQTSDLETKPSATSSRGRHPVLDPSWFECHCSLP